MAFSFIGASSACTDTDQDFADRLCSDLPAKGVRCSLASEDMKRGDKLRAKRVGTFERELEDLIRYCRILEARRAGTPRNILTKETFKACATLAKVLMVRLQFPRSIAPMWER